MKTVLAAVALLCLNSALVHAWGKAKKDAEPAVIETTPSPVDPNAPAAVPDAAVEESTAPSKLKAAASEVGSTVVDQAKKCASQKAKLAACDQLKWVAKMACRKLADKGDCLGL